MAKGKDALENMVEAALFASGEPIEVKDIELTTGIPSPDIRKALKSLGKSYASRDTCIEISKLGKKWVMQLRPEYLKDTAPITPTEISKLLLKTAALIAYYQPVNQVDLKEMVGGRVYGDIRELKKMGLISVKPKGRTKEITTTKEFIEHFGIDAADRDEMKHWLAVKVGISTVDEKADKIKRKLEKKGKKGEKAGTKAGKKKLVQAKLNM